MKIGILGGGQLSQLLALAGIPLGLEFYFYTHAANCSAQGLGTLCLGDYQNFAALSAFAEKVDLITYENENIPVEVLTFLAGKKPVFPDKMALTHSQDRLLEKKLFQTLGIPSNQFMPVDHLEDLHKAIQTLGYPLVLKKRSEGYDGKGQVIISEKTDLTPLHTSLKSTLAEEFIPFEREVSLIAARNSSGDCVYYDLSENQHKNGILRHTRNRPNDPLFIEAKKILKKLLEHLQYVGVLTIEFFVKDQQLIANEIAPRVHNSGHWTIEGAATSQFENHLRSILNWPLGLTQSLGNANLYNILSEMPAISSLLAIPGLHIYDYRKSPRPNRKLGHVTLVMQENEELNRLITHALTTR